MVTTCVKNSKQNDTSQVGCRHQGYEHLVLVKAKNLDAQEQPHPHHPKLEAARLGLLRHRHFCHCARVRLLARVLVSVLARDHVSVHDQPLSKPLSLLLHDPDQVKLLSHVPCLVHLHRCLVLVLRICLRDVRVHDLFHELRVQRLARRRRHRCRHQRRLGPLRLQHRSRRPQSRDQVSVVGYVASKATDIAIAKIERLIGVQVVQTLQGLLSIHTTARV